jgi:hypothetical protein
MKYLAGFALPNGAGAGKVLTSDGAGNGTWQPASGGVSPLVFDATLYTAPGSGVSRYAGYGNGTFVVADSGYNASTVWYSKDLGETWGTTTVPTTDQLLAGVAYGKGMFVVMSVNSSEAYVSKDGVTWSVRPTPAQAGYWTDVAYGNGRFVAVPEEGTAGGVSYDGLDWVAMTLPTVPVGYRRLAFADGLFVLTRSDECNVVYTSSDGVGWTSRTMPSTAYWDQVAFTNGLFIAVASFALGTTVAATSKNGTAWVSATVPAGGKQALRAGNGVFMLSIDTGDLYASQDCVTWSSISLPVAVPTLTVGSIAYGGGRFMLMDASVNHAVTLVPAAPSLAGAGDAGGAALLNDGGEIDFAALPFRISVSASAPISPQRNDLWLDIS